MLGAQIIISGAVSRIGGLYRLRVRALSVQSAQIAGQFNWNIPNSSTIEVLVQSNATGYAAASGGSAARTPARTARSPVTAQTSAPVPAAAPAYKIGDTGPGGGIVFYDKGDNSDGWRYMEAAPASTEWKDIQWGPNGEIKGTRVEMGAGKKNTRIIVNHAVAAGGNYRAAWLCDSLEYGEYDDWFLPSKAELNLMYLNLKERGLGGFITEWYWSSSEGGDNNSWTQGFGRENQINDPYGHWSEPYGQGSKDIGHNVRAIRQF
jgi:hypothetical protein